MPRPREAYTLTWRGVACRVEHHPDHINAGWSRLNIRVLSPAGAPLPFTESGWLRHELDEDDLKAAGGPVAFFTAWLERDAGSTHYAAALARWKQFDLFR